MIKKCKQHVYPCSSWKKFYRTLKNEGTKSWNKKRQESRNVWETMSFACAMNLNIFAETKVISWSKPKNGKHKKKEHWNQPWSIIGRVASWTAVIRSYPAALTPFSDKGDSGHSSNLSGNERTSIRIEYRLSLKHIPFGTYLKFWIS